MFRFLELLIAILIQDYVNSSKFDNSIVGNPIVYCEEKVIRLEFETLKPFFGKVFVKGEYHNPLCSQTYINSKKSGRHASDHSVLLKAEAVKSGDRFDSKTDTEILKTKLVEKTKPIAEAVTSNERSSHHNLSWTGTGGSTTHKKLSRMPYPTAFGGIQTEMRGETMEQTRDRSSIKVFQKSPHIENIRGTSEHSSSATVCPPCACDSPDIRSRRNTNLLSFTVPLENCNTKRERILLPPSLITSFVTIVSFHESFITKLDRAYHIQCAYTESSRPVLADLNVSMSVPSYINSTIIPPRCVYTIIDVNGQSAQDVRVGDLVRHQWKCHSNEPEQYKMLVHDCYVESGMNEKHRIIDEHGCTLDKYTFSTPTYSHNLTVSVDSYMFKLPDKTTMDFQCAIKLCSIHDDDCVIETPEKCGQAARKRRSHISETGDYAILYSNSLTVLDKRNIEESGGSQESKRASLSPQSATEHDSLLDVLMSYAQDSEMCFSHSVYGFLVFLLTFISTLSLTLLLAQRFIIKNDFDEM